MALPTIPLSTSTAEIAGQVIDIRSLSREEVTRLAEFAGDTDGAESFLLSCGTGVTAEEAAEWRKQVSAPNVALLLEAIGVLSGIRPGKGPKGN